MSETLGHATSSERAAARRRPSATSSFAKRTAGCEEPRLSKRRWPASSSFFSFRSFFLFRSAGGLLPSFSHPPVAQRKSRISNLPARPPECPTRRAPFFSRCGQLNKGIPPPRELCVRLLHPRRRISFVDDSLFLSAAPSLGFSFLRGRATPPEDPRRRKWPRKLLAVSVALRGL